MRSSFECPHSSSPHLQVVKLRLPGFQLSLDPQDDPLHLAIRSGLGLVVEELQLQITDPNTTNDENYNAIQHTPRAKNKAIASRLLDSGVSVSGDEFALWATAQGADYETFRLFLLHEGYGVFHNSASLKYAIRGGEEKVTRKVLRMTTSIDHGVILAAVESDRPRVLLLILKHSKYHYQNITAHINFGDLLIHAIQHDAISVIRILLCQLHANPCYAKHGRTALSYAAKRGRTDVISHLLRYDKVAPNLPDSDGQIPLDHILAGPEPHRETFQQNLELLALDSRTTPSSFNDGGKNMMKSLRSAHQYRLLETIRERGFEDDGYRKRKVTHENTHNKTNRYHLRSRRAE